MQIAITIAAATLTVPPLPLPTGALSQEQTVDLTEWQGQTARIYLTAEGAAHVNPDRDCWWQVAEVELPPGQYTDDEPRQPLPLDLAAHPLTVFATPA